MPSSRSAVCWVSPPAAIGRGASATLGSCPGGRAVRRRRSARSIRRAVGPMASRASRRSWQRAGTRCGRKRVARLMRGPVWRVLIAGARSTRRSAIQQARAAPDLVQRTFAASAPDQLWIADITYVPTRRGLPVSGRDPGCVQSPGRGLVHGRPPAHRAGRGRAGDGGLEPATRRGASFTTPDHGCQYTSLLFGERCQAVGIRCSMGSVGDSSENKQLTGTVARALILKTYGHEACDGDAPCLGGGLRQVHLVA